MKSLYDVLGMKGKSILKSVVINNFSDRHANVRIEIEAYDDTFLNAYNSKGSDYIFEQLEKKLKQDKVRKKIVDSLGIDSFNGALVTLYADRHAELYFKENGINQYDIQW